MKTVLTVVQARALLEKYLHQPHLLAHAAETEVIMRALARRLNQDEEFWGLTGLLHDLDMEETVDQPEKHGARTCQILREAGYDIPAMFQAILAHCENLGYLGVKRASPLDFCLSAAENITGLISAYVLMRPDKKIADTQASSINKKFKDKSFAAKVNRQFIVDIEKTGLGLQEFFTLAIDAMSSIAGKIGM